MVSMGILRVFVGVHMLSVCVHGYRSMNRVSVFANRLSVGVNMVFLGVLLM